MKRRLCMLLALMAIIITCTNVAYCVKDEFFYDLDDLPRGELLRTEINQNILFSTGNWLEVYEIKATSEHDSAIRVAIRNDNGNSHTIYWQIGTTENLITWPEDQGTTVIINGVPVDYMNGYYDCRDYVDFKYDPTNIAAETKRSKRN